MQTVDAFRFSLYRLCALFQPLDIFSRRLLCRALYWFGSGFCATFRALPLVFCSLGLFPLGFFTCLALICVFVIVVAHGVYSLS